MKQNLFQGAFSMLNFKKLFLGLLFSVLFSAVLIAVCAFMILKLGFLPSEPILGTAAAVIGGVSVFASAFLAARLAEEKGLLHGLVLGTLYAVFYVAISVMLYANMRVVLLVIRNVIFVICSVCGGVMGVNRDEKIRF